MRRTSTEPSRILILVKGLGIGGAETLISQTSALWDRDSFDYRVAYILPWKDQLVQELSSKGAEVTCLGGKRGISLGAAWRLRELCIEWRPRIVHSHLPAAAIMARLAVTGSAHFYTEHNLVDSYRQPTRSLNRATYWRNRAVIAVSDAVARGLEGYPGPDPTVIPNGVSVHVTQKQAEQARRDLGIGPEIHLVVHVGNIRPHKGHDNLIAAVGYLTRAKPDVVVVSIGGEKHEGDLDRIRRTARSAGLGDRIRFLGRRNDARDFLAAADVVVSPADVEGLPVAVLEALALAKPVVATAVGGVPSVIHHERSGLLVPPGDPQVLAKTIQRALTTPEAKRWGEEGARIVEQHHGLGRMVAAYEDLYRIALDE